MVMEEQMPKEQSVAGNLVVLARISPSRKVSDAEVTLSTVKRTAPASAGGVANMVCCSVGVRVTLSEVYNLKRAAAGSVRLPSITPASAQVPGVGCRG
eukprot:m.112226 g.112226  ORF g.112226 m.112226 type:complete len:98 (+) comp16169_c0_seq4:335-628(+)